MSEARTSGELDERYRLLLEELFAARRAGVVFGLERMREILDKLGNPQRRLGAIVHVAGTNGKGSTVAMIAAMVRAHGLRAAQYTSPHLATVRERIADDDGWIDRESFVAAADEVWAAGGAQLTFFEQITAIGFVALAARRPDVSVIEVGLGGRLDATNVVDSDVAVVTGVALDHQAMLGGTLELIAAEKAGIWRRGKPAIIGASGEAAAVEVLARLAREAGAAPVRVIGDEDIAAVPSILALAGEHQRRNAAAALAVIDALVAGGVLREDAAAEEERRGRERAHEEELEGEGGWADARAAGLVMARHPGRFELVGAAPVIVLDGAHNPHGAAALAEAVAELPRPRVLVLAVSSDKDVAGIAAPLLPRFEAVIATAYRQERALAPAALAKVLRAEAAADTGVDTGAHIEVAEGIEEALQLARRAAGRGGAVVVAGSLFLVGEARVALLGGEVDPIRLSDPSGPPK